MKAHKLLIGAVMAVLAVGCGKANPAEPSSASGANISGSIVSGGGSAGTSSFSEGPTAGPAAAPAVPPGLVVAVANTPITSTVDASGHFQLTNVPPGLANLLFSAPGLAAAVGLADLKIGDVVTIQVSLNSSTATVESDRRSNGREEQLEGRVESLPPTTAAGAFVVAGRTVTTNTSTQFTLQGQPATFASLALGQRVHVKGTTGTTGLLASSVMIQNTNTDVGLNINGIVSAFSGTIAAFQFTVDGRLVKGDAQTEFFGNSRFSDLANGARVEVKGSQRDAFVYATRLKVN
ncbi:MAG TPA: DUF5666 domain-containing protein [Vicinamibacterales bacterium]|nr:DUF5666 domain-containing protein [Vicinamibacterales bacterium]